MARDASKVALVALVERLRAGGATLLDVQWTTPHLRSLGALDIARSHYLALLAEAVWSTPTPSPDPPSPASPHSPFWRTWCRPWHT